MPPKKGYTRKYPNLGTVERIRALALYREDHLNQVGYPPIWTAACTRIGILPRTILRYAPMLAEKWYDVSFHL